MIGTCGSPLAARFLWGRFTELCRGGVEPELRLDVLETAKSCQSPTLRASATRWAAKLDAIDPVGALRLALEGGDAGRGARWFETHPAAQCVRCHTIDGNGGTAGPDLSGIGTRTRDYLLQSMVTPAAAIAEGYAANGQVMPPMRDLVGPYELRDLVEYLVSRHDAPPDVALGTLVPDVATTGAGKVETDRNCTGTALHIGGQVWARGVGVHAPSRLVYAVPRGARAFVARVGLDDGAPGGSVRFEVRVDGASCWQSGTMKFGRVAHAYAAIPEGARQLELLVDDAGNGVASDHADWVDAGFVKGARTGATPAVRHR
jgi:mono/diheme cytochrome c family protein